MRQLIESQQEVHDPQEFIQNLKVELYAEEVYTFTPKGQVKAFPRGATPIDFAYAIHTDVGHRCVGARINGKMVPLRTHLKNGDIVEIITQPGHKPSRDWLNSVVTSHARYEIKYLIRREERVRAIDLGRKVFEKDARKYDLNPRTLLEGDTLAKVLPDFDVQKVDELFAAIGYGKISSKQVLARLVARANSCARRRPRASSRPRSSACSAPAKKRSRCAASTICWSIRARCCNPIRGEKIVGYITRGRGVSVHSATCPNVVNLLYDPERRIDVEWDKGTEESRYTVKLTMEVEDRKGLLAAVSARVADINTNIKNMEAHTDEDRRARIDMTVEISDLKHLEKVIKSLRAVDGVLDVERAAR